MPNVWLRSILAALVAVTVVASGGSRAQAEGSRLKSTMSVAEFERCGLQKLTASELAALESWIARQVGGAASAPRGVQQFQPDSATSALAAEELVAFNTSSRKYHCASCRWARQCTRNCISIPLSEARKRGVPCKVCGGSCNGARVTAHLGVALPPNKGMKLTKRGWKWGEAW